MRDDEIDLMATELIEFGMDDIGIPDVLKIGILFNRVTGTTYKFVKYDRMFTWYLSHF